MYSMYLTGISIERKIMFEILLVKINILFNNPLFVTCALYYLTNKTANSIFFLRILFLVGWLFARAFAGYTKITSARKIENY